ncbi:photosystem II reaction center protein Psb28 [Geitlerinema sp. PCC 9228]|jgi:photosystem II Psb28-2 protein|uniref:photosystem II reaction center protein Psb28 n=1 Tax=Geitlerinema sp. PCC 9228 TaxID=111611 RepID=UPI0008F9A1F8|nr:photosystem II reaction center protein Psb28 [Geitlerinema sp. PCC 9228]
MTATVQFIEGLNETISDVSLRKRKSSDNKIVVLSFKNLKALEFGRSYINKIEHLWLVDEEGNIRVEPSDIRIILVDDDETSRTECSFEVRSQEVWERVMRFLQRYAQENGFEFQSK